MSGSWEKTQRDLSSLPPLFPSFSPSCLPQLAEPDSCLCPYRMRRLYSYCVPPVDREELLSMFGEKKGLVLWVDRNTWVDCRPAWYNGEMGG